MPSARINGIDLYYESHGEGPALVFAHGRGGNHLSRWQQVPEFSRGIVTLLNEERKKAASRRSSSGHRTPDVHRRGAEAAVRRRGCQMTLDVEGVVDGGMG